MCDEPLQEPPCDLALGTETIGSGALVLGLAPNSTLKDKLDAALLQLSEAGYLAGQSAVRTPVSTEIWSTAQADMLMQ